MDKKPRKYSPKFNKDTKLPNRPNKFNSRSKRKFVKFNSRTIAALTIEHVLHRGRSIDDSLESAYAKAKAQDKSIIHAICLGVLRHHGILLYRIQQLFDHKKDDTHSRILILLEIGIWQLANGFAEHAAIYQSVEACEQLGLVRAKGFLNALLRRVQREAEQQKLPYLPTEKEKLLPEWLNQLILANTFSQDLLLLHRSRSIELEGKVKAAVEPIWEHIVATHTQQPVIAIRLSPKRTKIDNYLEQLKKLNVDCELGSLPNSILLHKVHSIDKLPGFGFGAFCVQDEAAQCAAHILKPQPKTRVLDACSAPGGKASHLQELADNSLSLYAVEIDSYRSNRLRENLGRLRANGKVIIGSATNPFVWWDGRPYHKILLDAPCTGTGIMRRKPDIPWIKRNEDIVTLSNDSFQMLKQLWTMLDNNGQLLFATCSALAEENDLVIDRFLQETNNAEALDFQIPLQHINTLHGKQILPTAKNDSLYYCLLQKSKKIY